MPIMQYETWIKNTEVFGKPRSKYLKSVDQALQQYRQLPSDAHLSSLKVALHHWKMSKGYDAPSGKPAWMLSDRNRNKAVESLDLQVYGVHSTLAPDSALVELADTPFYGIEDWAGEAVARKALRDAREQALEEMFKGRKVTIRKSKFAISVALMKHKLSTAKKDAGQAAGAAASMATKPLRDMAKQAIEPYLAPAQAAANALIETILSPFPIQVAQEVMQVLGELIPQFMVELVGAVVPYVGVVTSGTAAMVALGQTVVAQYHREQSEQHVAAFAKGDAVAAVRAIQRMIERERNRAMRTAAIQAGDAIVKAAAHTADAVTFGAPSVSLIAVPLSGATKALALLGQQVFLLARDVQEKSKANDLLQSQIRLDAEIFDRCPLLGCYFIAGSTTSNIVNFLVDDIGSAGWLLDVETIVKNHIHPMVSMARGVIEDSPLEVEGLELSKAAQAKTTAGAHGVSNLTSRAKKRVMEKLNSVLPFRETLEQAPAPLRNAAIKVGFQPSRSPVLQTRFGR